MTQDGSHGNEEHVHPAYTQVEVCQPDRGCRLADIQNQDQDTCQLVTSPEGVGCAGIAVTVLANIHPKQEPADPDREWERASQEGKKDHQDGIHVFLALFACLANDPVSCQFSCDERDRQAGWAVRPLTGLQDARDRGFNRIQELGQPIFGGHGFVGERPAHDGAIRIAGIFRHGQRGGGELLQNLFFNPRIDGRIQVLDDECLANGLELFIPTLLFNVLGESVIK